MCCTYPIFERSNVHEEVNRDAPVELNPGLLVGVGPVEGDLLGVVVGLVGLRVLAVAGGQGRHGQLHRDRQVRVVRVRLQHYLGEGETVRL